MPRPAPWPFVDPRPWENDAAGVPAGADDAGAGAELARVGAPVGAAVELIG
jgi:hypothetical protein